MEQRKRIVVADDEKNVVRLLQIHLGKLGYQVVPTSDGEAALKLVTGSQPDLVILDVNMPRMDGFGVLQRLKADAKTANIPVIMLTARRQDPDVAHGHASGAHGYLNKPYEVSELIRLVREALGEGDPNEVASAPLVAVDRDRSDQA